MPQAPDRGAELQDIVYPNAPLRAVAVEVFFDPLLDALPRFGAFQRKRAAEFERLYLPAETQLDENAGRSALLMGTGRKNAIAVAPNQLTAITYEYSAGYAGFSAWALERLLEGLGFLDVNNLSKVSYRYENVIDLGRPPQIPSALLKLQLPSVSEAGAPRDWHLEWRQRWATGSVDVSIVNCEDVHPEIMNLMIAAELDRPIEVSELGNAIANARRMARLTFENLITDDYRTHLAGARHS